MKRRLATITIHDDERDEAFAVDDTKIILAGGCISAMRDNKTIASISITDFKKSLNAQLKALLQHVEH